MSVPPWNGGGAWRRRLMCWGERQYASRCFARLPCPLWMFVEVAGGRCNMPALSPRMRAGLAVRLHVNGSRGSGRHSAPMQCIGKTPVHKNAMNHEMRLQPYGCLIMPAWAWGGPPLRHLLLQVRDNAHRHPSLSMVAKTHSNGCSGRFGSPTLHRKRVAESPQNCNVCARTLSCLTRFAANGHRVGNSAELGSEPGLAISLSIS